MIGVYFLSNVSSNVSGCSRRIRDKLIEQWEVIGGSKQASRYRNFASTGTAGIVRAEVSKISGRHLCGSYFHLLPFLSKNLKKRNRKVKEILFDCRL
jgi:hypothetical protein